MQKNARFCIFSRYSPKKIQVAADRTTLTPACLPIAHLKPNGPHFSWKISKMARLLKLGVLARSKFSWTKFVSLKKCFYGSCFFSRIYLFWLFLTKWRYIIVKIWISVFYPYSTKNYGEFWVKFTFLSKSTFKSTFSGEIYFFESTFLSKIYFFE